MFGSVTAASLSVDVLGSGVAFAPEAVHVFESLASGFGDKFPDEEGCDDAEDAVEEVGEHVAETLSHRAELHVVHRHEGG